MDHLHKTFELKKGDAIEIDLSRPANVQLMDDLNYANYKDNKDFKYYGGYVSDTPYVLSIPRDGRWHIAIDLGGYPGSVLAEVRPRTTETLEPAI